MEQNRADVEKAETEHAIQLVHKSHDWESIAVFITQVVVVCTVIIAAVYNLTVNPNSNHDIWLVLLGTGFGQLLPNPSIQKVKPSKQ